MLPCVLTYGLEKPISPMARRIVFRTHQRFVDKVRQQVQDLPLLDCSSRAYGLRCFQRPPTDEDRKSTEETPFCLREQVVAPINSGFQCSLTCDGRTTPASEQSKAIVQALVDLFDR